MQRRHLGTSGLPMTPIALGLAALGRPGYLNLGHGDDLAGSRSLPMLEVRAHEVLDAAWAAGIRSFDVARSYGEAERFLGSWLRARNVAPGDVTISSKWGYTYTAGWSVSADVHEVKDHSLAVLQRQLGESQDLLGDHLALYQIHSATLESGVLDDQRVLDRLHALREERSLTIGLTLSGPGQRDTLLRALDVTRGGKPLFGAVQATWNLLERSVGDALRFAHAQGLVVIIKEAVANGRLTARNQDPAFARSRRLLEVLATQAGVGIDALAIAAVLARPFCDVVLLGSTTVQQLRANLGAQRVRWDEELEMSVLPLLEEPERYWSTRAVLPWT